MTLLTPGDTARFLSIEVKTLAVWRRAHNGPPYVRGGRVISYRLEVVGAGIPSGKLTASTDG